MTKKANQQDYQSLTTKILSLYRGNQSLNEITPGASISIETELDPSLTKADSLSGCIAGLENELPEITYKLKIKSQLFEEILGISEHKEVSPFKTKEMLMLNINTTITIGVIEKINKDEIGLSLNIPIVAIKGDNVGIARNVNGHWRLIGFGEII